MALASLPIRIRARCKSPLSQRTRSQSGVFRSPNYQPAQSGFAIATSGHAEFNEVHLRGRLTSSEIEASHIHAPAITLATAAGGRFRTHFLPRPVRAGLITMRAPRSPRAPLRIASDDHSHFFGDEARDILAAHDRSGDNAAADRNAYYHRFRARAPALTVHLSFTQSATSWGVILNRWGCAFACGQARKHFCRQPRPSPQASASLPTAL